jgi:hypothetical protein
MQAEVKDQFLRFIATKTDEAVFSPQDGYFPFSVIADAFEKGTEHGEEAFKQKVRDLYVKNIEIALDAVTKLIASLEEKGYKANKLFLNHSIQQTLILIAVDDKLNIDKDFIGFAYKVASDLQVNLLKEKGVNVCVNFLDSADINNDLLTHEGYTFKFNFQTKKPE